MLTWVAGTPTRAIARDLSPPPGPVSAKMASAAAAWSFSAKASTCPALSAGMRASVQPWEKGMGPKIEKAIRESDLGLNPAAMGDLLRVPMPPMSEERRKEMTKLVRHEGESAKIAIRNLRRDANEHVKKLVKDKIATEDELKRSEADVQKVTDKHIAEIDQLVAAKEKEIMEV